VFDYTHVTDETQAEYRAVLEDYRVKFREWATKNRAHKEETTQQAFELWWMFRGPQGFRSSADALRFKHELLTYVLAAPADV
jgi:hypothetical protein